MRKVPREWKPIEVMLSSFDVYVIKYDMWQKDGAFVEPHTPGAEKFTSCHGWYDNFETAKKVVAHFPYPSAYTIEKVHRRILKKEA